MKLRIVFFLLLIALATASVAAASDLFGTVKLNGKPLANAELTLKRGDQVQAIKTNDRGYYSIRKLEPGNYTLTVSLPQKEAREIAVYVFPQSTEKNIDLK